MQTQTHLIVTAALRYPLQKQSLPVHKRALWLGAVLPDIPFTLLSIGYALFYKVTKTAVPAPTLIEHLNNLFFNDPIWIIGHNTFHSVIINGLLILLGYWLLKRKKRYGLTLFWLAASMQLHSIIDIFTHTSDGPLFLFPLSWTIRFRSPISYWESGLWFTLLEYSLDIILLLFLFYKWRQSRTEKTT